MVVGFEGQRVHVFQVWEQESACYSCWEDREGMLSGLGVRECMLFVFWSQRVHVIRVRGFEDARVITVCILLIGLDS